MIEVAVNQPCIMVVDDEQDILTLVARGLEQGGNEVHGFINPILALQHLEVGCKECEVLVSDIKMPQMTGFQLVKRIKELRPEMKIIMMTAFETNRAEFEAAFPSAPVENILRKPFTLSRLSEMIKEVRRESLPRS